MNNPNRTTSLIHTFEVNRLHGLGLSVNRLDSLLVCVPLVFFSWLPRPLKQLPRFPEFPDLSRYIMGRKAN